MPAVAARAGLVGDDLGNLWGCPARGWKVMVPAGPERKMLEPKAEPLPPPLAPVLGAIVAVDVSGPREASRCCPAARRSRAAQAGAAVTAGRPRGRSHRHRCLRTSAAGYPEHEPYSACLAGKATRAPQSPCR
jgi:hypothetical protein